MVTLLKAVAMGDLIRIWALAERAGVDFNYIAIPADHPEANASSFDPAEMQRLFDLGHEIATGDKPWRKDPPTFFELGEEDLGELPK